MMLGAATFIEAAKTDCAEGPILYGKTYSTHK